MLLSWTLSDSVFPGENPGLSDSAYLAMAVAAAVLFFTSLLLHELGHALQARREGVEIDGITLWLFGGVARFRGMFPSAGAEFRIAIAGPLVSLAIGVVFVLAAWLLRLPRAVDGVASWLGFINLFLLVFNLMPALPLDGGRVLRSTLWARSGDLAAATRTAGGVARSFAYLLIGGGLAELVVLGSVGGVWLAFLGWFLLQAAAGEARALVARQALGGLRVGDLMSRDPATVHPASGCSTRSRSWTRATSTGRWSSRTAASWGFFRSPISRGRSRSAVREAASSAENPHWVCGRNRSTSERD